MVEKIYDGAETRDVEKLIHLLLCRSLPELELELLAIQPGYKGIDIVSKADAEVAIEVESSKEKTWRQGDIMPMMRKNGVLVRDHCSIPYRKKIMFERHKKAIYIKVNYTLDRAIVIKGCDVLGAPVELKDVRNSVDAEKFFMFREDLLERCVIKCPVSELGIVVKRMIAELNHFCAPLIKKRGRPKIQ